MKPTSHSNPSFEWLRKQLEDESRPQRKQPPLPSLDDMTRLYVERMEICNKADNNIKRTIEMHLEHYQSCSVHPQHYQKVLPRIH